MKIDLIGMILNKAGRRHFDGAVIDDNGVELDAVHSLDFMILEYAKVRAGGESSVIAVPNSITLSALPRGSGHVTCRPCNGTGIEPSTKKD